MNDTNFDIFISFKDRDNDSNRTVSSRLAEDIYDTLDVKGYSVFYSRFVLPGMVGGQYEPVINHALETAKLLVLVFTNADEVNSEWVKHEWKYFSKHDKPILTVFKDCGNARLENLPYVISQLQYCDLTDGSKRQYEFMLKRIDEIMKGKLPTVSPEQPREEEKKPTTPTIQSTSSPKSDQDLKKKQSNSSDDEYFDIMAFFEKNETNTSANLSQTISPDSSDDDYFDIMSIFRKN